MIFFSNKQIAELLLLKIHTICLAIKQRKNTTQLR